jgi:hypothetical protein
MDLEPEAARARRYLLGQLSDEEREAVEREYFHSDELVDRIEAAEDDLIDDYLGNSLGPLERRLFEQEYLSSPHHRRRVEIVRQLIGRPTVPVPAASATSAVRRLATGKGYQWLAAAAAVVVVIAGSLWILSPARRAGAPVVENAPPVVRPPEPSASAPPASGTPSTSPRVFALALSPVAVRSAGGDAPLTIPAGTDFVSVTLEDDGGGQRLAGGRAVIRTVGGGEIWQGPATVDGDLPAGALARIQVPAARLGPDDYVITLFQSDAPGFDRERSRYFLRVRAR